MREDKLSIPVLPLFLVALSLALNLHALTADSFWGDEIFTATFANHPPLEIIRWTANDIHPPLYYLLAGAFTKLVVPLGLTELPTPASDWLWRFPSVIAGILTVAVTYRLAFHISHLTPHASRLIASAAALLLCLAPIALKYGQEARMHALFMFLSTLSTWLLFRALAQPQRWYRWLAFAIATTANIYTMYFGFLILAAQAGLFLFTIYDLRFMIYDLRFMIAKSPIQNPAHGRQAKSKIPPQTRRQRHASERKLKSKITGFSTAIVLVLLAYLPWWPVLFNILRRRAAVGAIEGGVGNPLDFIRGVIQALGPGPEPVAWGFLFLFLIGLASLAGSARPPAILATLWLALPIALPIVLGDPRALQFRYAFVLPVYLTVIAYATWHMAQWVNRQMGDSSHSPALLSYFIWLLATLSFIATLGIYNQTKPDWRSAAAYLTDHVEPADIILIGPLWDEGRFIGYYYREQAQLLTPAALVTNIERHAETLRANGGRVWAVNRFAPAESPAMRNIIFPGVTVSEPQLTVYEPTLLSEAAIDLAAQAVEAAYPWAAEAEAQGVLNPDPRTAKAAALRAWGDALVAAGRLEEAIGPYQTAVDIFPGWVSGFITLAKTQEAVGNLAAAAEAYRQAVTFNLKWHGPQANEAAALVEAGQWSVALDKYHHIIATQ